MTRKSLHGFDAYVICASDKKTQATIVPERGAWVASLIMNQREILFQHDYAWNPTLDDLPGGIPFLFPVCARIERNNEVGKYLLDGKQYELKIHGFSWYMRWEVIATAEDRIEMVLHDNAETLLRYPFYFEVKLIYQVLSGKLICHQSYVNRDTRAMPYYAGFHPYILTPQSQKEKVMVAFESIQHFQYNNALTDIINDNLPLIRTPVSIMDASINEQLSKLDKNKRAMLIFSEHEKIYFDITENPDYFPYLQLYTIPEREFFCVEHWMGFPNALNTVSGVRWLAPGETESATYEIGVDTLHTIAPPT